MKLVKVTVPIHEHPTQCHNTDKNNPQITWSCRFLEIYDSGSVCNLFNFSLKTKNSAYLKCDECIELLQNQ